MYSDHLLLVPTRNEHGDGVPWRIQIISSNQPLLWFLSTLIFFHLGSLSEVIWSYPLYHASWRAWNRCMHQNGVKANGMTTTLANADRHKRPSQNFGPAQMGTVVIVSKLMRSLPLLVRCVTDRCATSRTSAVKSVTRKHWSRSISLCPVRALGWSKTVETKLWLLVYTKNWQVKWIN
jgi:hypothetical protein